MCLKKIKFPPVGFEPLTPSLVYKLDADPTVQAKMYKNDRNVRFLLFTKTSTDARIGVNVKILSLTCVLLALW